MNHFLRKFSAAWLLAGTLDISAAFIQYYIKTGKGPAGVLNYIASAVFGKQAFNDGNSMLLWGLFFHYCVVFCFTAFFFFIFKPLFSALKNKVVIAVVYAVFMWTVMQVLVLPLTKAPKLTLTLQGAVTAILILIVCIGLPLSFIAGEYHKRKSRTAQ